MKGVDRSPVPWAQNPPYSQEGGEEGRDGLGQGGAGHEEDGLDEHQAEGDAAGGDRPSVKVPAVAQAGAVCACSSGRHMPLGKLIIGHLASPICQHPRPATLPSPAAMSWTTDAAMM